MANDWGVVIVPFNSFARVAIIQGGCHRIWEDICYPGFTWPWESYFNVLQKSVIEAKKRLICKWLMRDEGL